MFHLWVENAHSRSTIVTPPTTERFRKLEMIRFQKRLSLLPGVRLNISKSGISTSLGPRGASINVGRRGIYGNIGVPGTGLSYRQRLDAKTKQYDSAESILKTPADNVVGEQDSSEEKKRRATKRVEAAQDALSEFGSQGAWINRTDLLRPLSYTTGNSSRSAPPRPAPMLERLPYLLRLGGLALALFALSLNLNEINASLTKSNPLLPAALVTITIVGAIGLLGVWTARRTRHIGLPWWLGLILLPLGFAFQPIAGLAVLAALCLFPGKN